MDRYQNDFEYVWSDPVDVLPWLFLLSTLDMINYTDP